MIHPCPRKVLCPPGSGSQSDGVNYSSETPEVPVYYGNPFPPPTIYGTYTACRGLCVSQISQADADLCAQRSAKVCSNESVPTGPGNTPKQTFSNTIQVCTVQSTGRQVVVPAGLFIADSQAEADAQALSYANKLQQDPTTPPGPNTIPPPTDNPPVIINTIPTPRPQPPPKPPTPPASQCKPCDDTVGVDTVSIPFDVPDGGSAQGPVYTPRLKCGKWRFWIETNVAAPQAVQNFVTATLVASNPEHTLVDSGSLVDCPQMAWIAPCGHGVDCTPADVGQYGIFPGCCDVNYFDCQYAECQTIDGQHYLVEVMLYFVPGDVSTELAHQFTFKGQWTGPLPTTP